MKLTTLSEAADYTGKTWRTVKRRAEEAGLQPVKRTKKADFYASDALCAVIFAAESADSGDLDLNKERARLAKWQADKTEQDVELRAGRLLEADAVIQWIGNMIATVKSRLVQVPDAVGHIVDARFAAAVAAEVRRLIYEALEELSASGGPGALRDLVGSGATADPDGERVGGSVPKTVKRKQRGAGAVED